jgi:hypothetical protein
MTKKKNNNKIFIWILVVLIIGVGGTILYNTQVKPLFEVKETVEEKDLEIKELEAENLLLRQQIEQNLTVTEEKEVKKLGFMGLLGWLGFIGCGGALAYVLIVKPQEEEKNMEMITKFMREYIPKIEDIKLYRRVKYYKGSYKGQKQFLQALIVFCLNPKWGVDNDRFYLEPPKEQLIGYLVNRRNPKDIIETFDQGDKTCEDMLEAVKKTHWGMRGIHYEAHEKPEWQKELERQQYGVQEAAKQYKEFERLVKE